MKLLQMFKDIFSKKEQKTVGYIAPRVIPKFTEQDLYAVNELELELMKNSKKGVK